MLSGHGREGGKKVGGGGGGGEKKKSEGVGWRRGMRERERRCVGMS